MSSTSDNTENKEVKEPTLKGLKNSEQTEQREDIIEELKVDDLQALPVNGNSNSKSNNNIGNSSVNGKQSVVPSTPSKSTATTSKTNSSLLVVNGGLEKGKDKDKEKEKKTPKKSPRKVLMAIIPSSDDEKREKSQQVALGHVRPKCCTIS